MISQEYLKSQLSYSSETGMFIWKVSKKGQSRKDAGYTRKDGYIKIVIDQVRYLAHRLAFFYEYGYLPKYIDHINGNPSDNRICNLREATISQNGINKPLQSNNKSGYKGVYWNKSHGKWMARININNKTVFLGLFDDLNNAAYAYKNAAIELHGNFINNNGVIQ